MKKITILFVLLATTFLFAVNNPMSWQNDVYDCDAMKYNGEYYFSGNFLNGDMLISRDLRNWGWRTHVFSYNNSWHSGTDRDIHGSHMRYENGVFHYYAHLGTADGITHATNPVSVLGPYKEPVTSHNFADWIDSDTFKDDDGSFTFYSTKLVDGESIFSWPMTDLFTLSGGTYQRISPSTGDGSSINEASKVFKYRDRYYMLYNTYDTTNYDYRIRGVEAGSPITFGNSGKYADPIIVRKTLDATREIVRIGQPWVVEGPNGFERWVGYFAHVATSGTITEQGQYIDRLYFLGDDLKADAPTHRDSSGYHPPPSKPEYLGLFNETSASLPTNWTLTAGTWSIVDNELRQTTATGFKNVILNHKKADNFLAEANVKIIGSGSRAGLCVVKDGSDWLRVGFDQTANRWFYQRMNDSTYDTANYALPAGFNYQAYHKIQLQKNGNTVYIKIDDIPSPTLNSISVNFDGAALPELFTDNAQAAFDGVIYTIGWDEWNSRVQYWGPSKSGFPQVGTWNYGSWGIDQLSTNGSSYIFKGDFMDEYEIDARCTVRTANANAGRRVGIVPVAVDASNYMIAEVDPATSQLLVLGKTNNVDFSYSGVSITSASAWNIRAVKLKNKVIVFVNGRELLTAYLTYGASQVGLITENQDAIFSTILVYETKDKTLPSPWQETDLGDVKYEGRADFTEGFITINGSGADFWHTGDEGHFVYQQIDSDKEIIAKVEMSDPASYWTWTKACVMIRENLSSNSPMAFIALTKMDANNTNSAQFIWRSFTGAGTGISTIDRYKMFPSYIKLTRIGNTFAGYWSPDGETWTFVGSTDISMSKSCYIGLGYSAQNADRFGGAVFSDVKVQDVSADTIAFWRFENGVNGQKHGAEFDNFYVDSSGNGNHLSSSNSAWRPTAINDLPYAYTLQNDLENTMALDFIPNNGIGTYGAHTGAKMIETYMFDVGWTIECSFKADSYAWQVLIGKDGKPVATHDGTAFCIKLRDDNHQLEVFGFDNSTNAFSVQNNEVIELGKWYNLAVTFNGSVLKIYLKEKNDYSYVLKNSVTVSAGISLGQWAHTWTVGRGMWVGNMLDHFDGKIDEIRISNSAISPDNFLAVDKNLDGDAWNVDANGSWETSGNWLGGNIPDAVGKTAFFTNDISADRFISMSSDHTVGNICMSDPSGNNRWAIEGGGGALTLDKGDRKPIFDVGGDGLWGATYASPLEGKNGFVKIGNDNLQFWAANNISGTVIAAEGSIDAKVDGVLQNADIVVMDNAIIEPATPLKTFAPKSIEVKSGGKIRFSALDTYTLDAPLTFNGGNALCIENDNVNVTNNGAITLNQSSRIFNWGNGGYIVMNGAVSGSGDLEMIGQAAGSAHTKSFYINAQNTYSGNTYLSAFACSTTFEINGHQRFPNTGLIIRDHEWSSEDFNIYLDMNSYTQRVSSLYFAPGTSGGDYIEVRGGANAEIGVSGTMTLGGNGIVKLAGGKISVEGSCAFNYPMTVENATLIANGTASGGATLTIDTGGKLGGSGAVANTLVKSNGKLSPGNSIDTLTTGNLEMQAGSLYDWEFTATTLHEADLIDCAALTLQTAANSITVNVIITFGFTMFDDTNSLFSATSISGNANSIFLDYSGSSGINGPANPVFDGNDVIVTGITPEPGIIGLVGLITLAFFRKNVAHALDRRMPGSSV